MPTQRGDPLLSSVSLSPFPTPRRKYAENMYYFSELALTLNAPEGGTAPTDSRRRPDQRLMENGRWDEANAEKQRLEEKQRLSRKRREAEAARATEDGEGPLGPSVCSPLHPHFQSPPGATHTTPHSPLGLSAFPLHPILRSPGAALTPPQLPGTGCVLPAPHILCPPPPHSVSCPQGPP